MPSPEDVPANPDKPHGARTRYYKPIWYAPNKFEAFGDDEIQAVVECLKDGWLVSRARWWRVDLSATCSGTRPKNHSIRGAGKLITWILGFRVGDHRQQVSGYFGKKSGIFVNSGSSANVLALKICDLKPGDEVITPACTFSTTGELRGIPSAICSLPRVRSGATGTAWARGRLL